MSGNERVPVTVSGKVIRMVFDSGATIGMMRRKTMIALGPAASITHHQTFRIKFMDEMLDLSLGVLAPLLVTVAERVDVWVSFYVYPEGFERRNQSDVIPVSVLMRYGARHVFHLDGTSRIYFRGSGDEDLANDYVKNGK